MHTEEIFFPQFCGDECISKPIFSGSFRDVLNYLRDIHSKFERSKHGSIVVDNVELYFSDLHSFYFELDQIFNKNLYGFKTEKVNPVIIDCGSHVGLASIYFARRYPQSQIHAFEADPKIYDIFQFNTKSARLTNVISHAKAVWIHNNCVRFRLSGDDSGHIGHADGMLIPSIRLKDYLELFERIDMLKLDVEGAEYEIIEDCLPVLNRVQRMVVEVHRLSEDKKSLANLLGCLERSGFQYVLSDLHSASWAQADHIPPFDFVTHDKFIVTVFAWRQTDDHDKISYSSSRLLGQPRIVQFCWQDFGGAGTAAVRLHNGLLASSINSTFYVHNIQRWEPATIPLLAKSSPFPIPDKNYISNGWKEFEAHNQRIISNYPRRPQGLEIFSDTWAATNLSNIPDIAEADVIHLHWIDGTVDISREVEFLKTKKIVWTLHDMNSFTGGCHYTAGCQKYEQQCGSCPQLGSSRDNDLSRQIWTRKMAAYKQLDMTIVALCQWMADCVKKSSLLSSFPVHVIPNGLPTDIFKPYPQVQIRESLQVPKDVFVILFGADSVTNARKGFVHLLRALEHLDTLNTNEQIALATFGNHAQTEVQHLGFPTFPFDYVDKESELALVYSMADVTVIPSLEDNLPNVILESLACGTPVVGFDVGGIPDMVEHQANGYLAPVGDDKGLAEGMRWVMEQKRAGSQLRVKCRETALSRYDLPLQVQRYRELYGQLLSRELSHDLDMLTCTEPSIIDHFKSLNRQSDQSLSLWALRLRRQMLLTVKRLEEAETAGRLVLDHDPEGHTHDDLEAYYHIGLEMHKLGQLDSATAVYEHVLNHPATGTSLSAWAAFKQGEAFDESGNHDVAKEMYFKALEYNPSHAKARIYLVAPDEPLRVCLGGTNSEGMIDVPMDTKDEEMWEYYFARRQPDFVRICLNAKDFANEASKLEKIAKNHLASEGELEIIIADSLQEKARNF